jgi:predicted nucleotidyltransferase
MLTQRIALKHINDFLNDLKAVGYTPEKAFLFGSVAKGSARETSDIDLAVWDKKFSGCLAEDYEPIKKILRKHFLIELHTFPSQENEFDNPFISEIEKTGVRIDF